MLFLHACAAYNNNRVYFYDPRHENYNMFYMIMCDQVNCCSPQLENNNQISPFFLDAYQSFHFTCQDAKGPTTDYIGRPQVRPSDMTVDWAPIAPRSTRHFKGLLLSRFITYSFLILRHYHLCLLCFLFIHAQTFLCHFMINFLVENLLTYFYNLYSTDLFLRKWHLVKVYMINILL